MTGRLSLALSAAWKARYAAGVDRVAVEARIPADHYLAVCAVGTNPRLWRIALFHEGDIHSPLWRIEVAGALPGALDFALTKHELVAA